MKATTSQKIKIGIFTLAGILLFAIGIFYIGSKKSMFGDTYHIYGIFREVGGLEIGNNIRFAGINVGTVEDISIISDTLIRVDMLMENDVKPFLKTDALATIASDGLMGDKLVTINPGSANEVRLLAAGSRIRTVNPFDFDKVISQFTRVAGNADIIMSELARMAIQIRTGDGSISKLLYTDDFAQSLEGTADNAEKITASLASIANHIRSGKGSVGSLIYTDSLSQRLEKAANTANASMITIQGTASTFEEAAYNFNENMKALQGNIFFRGYFRRKERNDNKDAEKEAGVSAPIEGIDADLNEAELEKIITEAQKALDEKRGKGKK